VALSQLVPYYLDAAMTDPPTGTVPAECPVALRRNRTRESPGEVITLTADLIGCTGTAGLEIVSNRRRARLQRPFDHRDREQLCRHPGVQPAAASRSRTATVTGFPFGLYLSGVTSSTVSGNTVTGGQKGISLSFSQRQHPDLESGLLLDQLRHLHPGQQQLGSGQHLRPA
jgi:parallel beta-helix repeat protein